MSHGIDLFRRITIRTRLKSVGSSIDFAPFEFQDENDKIGNLDQ